MTDTVAEVAQVGTTLELEADTKYALLSTLTGLKIYYKQARGSTLSLDAVVSSASSSETKMKATLASTANLSAGKMRVWSEARGSGTILFKGRRRFIDVQDPERS